MGALEAAVGKPGKQISLSCVQGPCKEVSGLQPQQGGPQGWLPGLPRGPGRGRGGWKQGVRSSHPVYPQLCWAQGGGGEKGAGKREGKA